MAYPYPTPFQIDHCGPIEAIKLVKQFVKTKLTELIESINLDKFAFRSIYFRKIFLKLKLEQCSRKFAPLLKIPVAYWHRVVDPRFLAVVGKMVAVYDRFRQFKVRYDEAVTARNEAFRGLDAIQKTRITQANSKRILKEMWTDPRYTNWSNITFSQLDCEWIDLRLNEDATACLDEWEQLFHR
ncbi:unnamed protein product [Orchesella dallaii]|uniref:Uncharacterized protein n=1 Tax=Orchesella dallaii TaxID=48710 RepID=A0ABP1PZY9_9HEXA